MKTRVIHKSRCDPKRQEGEFVCSANKQRRYSEARSLVAFLAVEEVGYPAAEVARTLGISRMGVQKAVMRGSELKTNHPALEK